MSATTAAVPFWRAAGMTYIGYSNICAKLVRGCLKEPFKSEAASRELVHFSVAKWTDGDQKKPSECPAPPPPDPLMSRALDSVRCDLARYYVVLLDPRVRGFGS